MVSKESIDQYLKSPKFKEAVEFYRAQFAEDVDSDHRTYSILKFVDTICKKSFADNPELTSKISCKKGCSHCCHVLVGASYEEARLALRCGKENGLSIENDILEKQVEHSSDEGDWGKLSHKEKKCVFLNEKNECSIYEYRPMACRSYFVINDPEKCDLRHGKQDVQILDMPRINAIIFAASSIFTPERFVKALSKLKRRS